MLYSHHFDLMSGTLAGIANVPDFEHQIPTLCLHGWLDNAASFEPLLHYFSKHHPEHAMLAIDWPGHGLSSHKSDDAHYHFVDYVYDLLLLLENQAWPKVNIVAHSMGGMIASCLAAAFPEKVKSLVLLDSVGVLFEQANKATEVMRIGLTSRIKGAHKQQINDKRPMSIEDAIVARMMVSDLSYEHAKLIISRSMHNHASGYLWRSDSRLRYKSPYRFTKKQAIQIVSDISCPVKLVLAKQGLTMIKQLFELFREYFSDMEYIELPGGHHLHMEQPEQVATQILSFQAKV